MDQDEQEADRSTIYYLLKNEAKYRSAGTIMVERSSVTNCRDKVSRVSVEWGASQDVEAALVGANPCVEMQQQDLSGSAASNPATALSHHVGATAAANAAPEGANA